MIIEQDEDGIFVSEVPQLPGCYTQGHTLDELIKNIREVIELSLEEQAEGEEWPEFVGIQKVLI